MSADGRHLESGSRPAPVVVYIVASPRSGTTILGNLLGELDGWHHVGELRDLWTPGMPEPRRRCGCGRPLHECSVWQSVFATLVAKLDLVDLDPDPDGPTVAHALDVELAERMSGVQRRWLRTLFSPILAYDNLSRRVEGVNDYVAIMDELYGALSAATGSSVIVDSSKTLPEALLLSRMSLTEARVVHVVRDGRGVVMSRIKRRATERPDGSLKVDRRLLVLESLRWSGRNLWSDVVLGIRRRKTLNIRYEELIEHPAETVGRIGRFACGVTPDLRFVDGDAVVLSENHTISGNRNRWQHGRIQIREDLSWRTGLGRIDRGLISLSTGLCLMRYRYLSAQGRGRWGGDPDDDCGPTVRAEEGGARLQQHPER